MFFTSRETTPKYEGEIQTITQAPGMPPLALRAQNQMKRNINFHPSIHRHHLTPTSICNGDHLLPPSAVNISGNSLRNCRLLFNRDERDSDVSSTSNNCSRYRLSSSTKHQQRANRGRRTTTAKAGPSVAPTVRAEHQRAHIEFQGWKKSIRIGGGL